MSEKTPEQAPQHEAFEIKTPEHMALPDAEHAEGLRAGEQDPTKQLEAARSAVESAPADNTAAENLNAAAQASVEPAPTHVNKELESTSLSRELKHIRGKLAAPDKALSKVIHTPAVRMVSEASGKTLARPSGLFGGGLVAFIGTTSYLLFAKHIGVQYNYFVFLIFFAGGFALGLLLELVVWSVTRKHRA
ncbi:MAG: hypothetical protein JWO41_7 [Candidatus Saccharibacteria bacterium]|nr:hypothetical protein [Candidatus Saccharibacteria bacterium]